MNSRLNLSGLHLASQQEDPEVLPDQTFILRLWLMGAGSPVQALESVLKCHLLREALLDRLSP